MRQEIDPKETSRATAFELWMKSPMPMVTVVKTFDVTRIYRKSKKGGIKFNTLLCWCIGKAASKIEECYLFIENGKLYQYDRLAVNVIANHSKGGICSCDVPFSDDFDKFSRSYDELTRKASETCQDITDKEAAIIGTSVVLETEIDCIVNQYTGIFNNPFLAWGRYRHHWWKTTLNISLQFHHALMDGAQAARLLNELQAAIRNV